MAIRDDILSNVTTQLNSTSVGVSTELPWNSGGTPLYNKNKKKFYLSEESQDIITLQPTIDETDVFQKEVTMIGYISVDAKTQPSDIDQVVARVINSRLSIADNYIRECNMTTNIDNDLINYEFNFRFVNLI